MASLGRRAFPGAAAATWASVRAPRTNADAPPSAPQDLDVRDFTVEGDPVVGNRFVLCVPAHLAKDEKVPLLVALHGAAEMSDPRTGAYAFVERYGLVTAYARLRRPPVVRTFVQQDYFGDKLLAELNASLASQPFSGLAIACPYMPYAAHMEHETKVLDRYASWIADVVVPRARKEAPVYADMMHTTIDGVSLGGRTGIECFAPTGFVRRVGVRAGGAGLAAGRRLRRQARCGVPEDAEGLSPRDEHERPLPRDHAEPLGRAREERRAARPPGLSRPARPAVAARVGDDSGCSAGTTRASAELDQERSDVSISGVGVCGAVASIAAATIVMYAAAP